MKKSVIHIGNLIICQETGQVIVWDLIGKYQIMKRIEGKKQN
ncbi:hypothetical protein CHCC14562_0798 [Bacillus licheniformis]|nr:hypothetical protein CHCC14562_0798 [Bacillus licheniformis]